MDNRAGLIVGLTIASFVVMLAYAVINLLHVQREVFYEIEESTLWMATEAERETLEFLLSLTLSDPARNESPELRFELLYSRVALLTREPQARFFREIGLGAQLDEIAALVAELDAVNKTQSRSPEDTLLLQRKAGAIAASFRDIAMVTNLRERSTSIERRNRLANGTNLLLFAILGIVVTGLIMSALLLRNLQSLVQTQRALEGHRNSLEETVVMRTRELREALNVERRAREVYRSFIITVSHQFRTPVSIIHMITQRQLRDSGLSATLRHKMQRIHDAATRLEHLLGGFLAAARMEREDIILDRRSIDLNEVILSAIEQCQISNPSRRITAQLAPESVPLKADPLLLEQVFVNLLGNAVKYSPSSSVVSVISRRQGSMCYCDVIDQGLGIPEEARPAIFERFYRAENVHHLQGVGVGLGLVRDIVQLHGGSVSFTSELGKGTTFTVTLPVCEVEEGS